MKLPCALLSLGWCGLSLIAGCDHSGSDDAPPATPADVPPPTTAPATAPASTQVVYIDINGEPTQFPPVRMQLVHGELGITARLSTVALHEDADPGTGLQLEVPTRVHRVEDLDGLDCPITPEPMDVEAQNNGFVLDDGLKLLSPQEAVMTFRGQPPQMLVVIDGKFGETGDKPVDVHAELRVPVEVSGSGQ